MDRQTDGPTDRQVQAVQPAEFAKVLSSGQTLLLLQQHGPGIVVPLVDVDVEKLVEFGFDVVDLAFDADDALGETHFRIISAFGRFRSRRDLLAQNLL